jgi:hypothetical protein
VPPASAVLPVSEAVSWAESPILIGPAGETRVEIVGEAT